MLKVIGPATCFNCLREHPHEQMHYDMRTGNFNCQRAPDEERFRFDIRRHAEAAKRALDAAQLAISMALTVLGQPRTPPPQDESAGISPGLARYITGTPRPSPLSELSDEQFPNALLGAAGSAPTNDWERAACDFMREAARRLLALSSNGGTI